MERLTCKLVDQRRSTLLHADKVVDIEEAKPRRRLREIAAGHNRWGRRIKFLNIIDVPSRLCLAMHVSLRCEAKDMVAALFELTSLYPAPAFICSDDGPEFISHALRRWCNDSGATTA